MEAILSSTSAVTGRHASIYASFRSAERSMLRCSYPELHSYHRPRPLRMPARWSILRCNTFKIHKTNHMTPHQGRIAAAVSPRAFSRNARVPLSCTRDQETSMHKFIVALAFGFACAVAAQAADVKVLTAGA